MRKLLLVSVLFLLMSTTVAADGFDIASATTDELIAMQNEIEDELLSRITTSRDIIYRGEYIIGKDIKAGEYVYECTSLSDGYRFNRILVYDNQEARDNMKGSSLSAGLGEKLHFNFVDDMIVIFVDGIGTLRSIAKPSWAP